MAFGHMLDEDDSATLCNLTGAHDLVEVTVYDADFPDEAGQRFVTAVLARGDQHDTQQIDLTDSQHEELSDFLHGQAEVNGETVKFFLALRPTLHIKAKVENIYADGEEVTTHVETSLPFCHEDEGSDEYDEWADEWLMPLTGTGKTEGDAGYFLEITWASDAEFIGREFEWGI